MTSDACHSVDGAPKHFPKRNEPYTQRPTCRILLIGLLRMGGFKKTGGGRQVTKSSDERRNLYRNWWSDLCTVLGMHLMPLNYTHKNSRKYY